MGNLKPQKTEIALPRAVFFDWDKTLVDNWDAIVHATNETLKAMDMAPWTDQEARMRIRKSAREAFPELFGSRADEAIDVFYGAFEKLHCTELCPLPGAFELLEHLSASDVPLGVVSNKTADYLNREIAHLGWDGLFRSVVGAGEAHADKPDPAPIILALERAGLGGPDANVWYVGDNEMDMICARRAGCMPVLVDTMGLPQSHFHEADAIPEITFESCGDLLAFFNKNG